MEKMTGMIKISMHNHSENSFDSESSMIQMVSSAIDNNFKFWGFSEHQDFDNKLDEYLYLDYDIYTKNINEAKDKFSDKITLFKSIEIDYQKQFKNDILAYLKGKNFDYIVGSIHYLYGTAIDLPSFKEIYNKKGIDKIISDYLDEVLNLVKTDIPDILGHLDLIKLYTQKIDIQKHKAKFLEIFDIMKKKNIILEINYAGLRKDVKEAYPSKEILELYYENGNRLITISADAHNPEHVEFNPDLSYIKKIGFDAICYPNKGKIIKLDI